MYIYADNQKKRGADIYDEEKSKKLLLWLFVLTFVLTGIAGCGTKQKDDQEAASTETAGAISSVDDIVGKKDWCPAWNNR